MSGKKKRVHCTLCGTAVDSARKNRPKKTDLVCTVVHAEDFAEDLVIRQNPTGLFKLTSVYAVNLAPRL